GGAGGEPAAIERADAVHDGGVAIAALDGVLEGGLVAVAQSVEATGVPLADEEEERGGGRLPRRAGALFAEDGDGALEALDGGGELEREAEGEPLGGEDHRVGVRVVEAARGVAGQGHGAFGLRDGAAAAGPDEAPFDRQRA